MSPDAFARLLRHPSTGPRLDHWLAEDARIVDAVIHVPPGRADFRVCERCASTAFFVEARADGVAVYSCQAGHVNIVAPPGVQEGRG